MLLNELRDKPGANKKAKRVGRGIGSGSGKTAGRGEKGQKSRSGVALMGYEGGQMPIYRRLPKRGFKNPLAKDYAIVSVGRIQQAIDSGKLDDKNTITAELLKQAGIVRRIKDGIRLLSDGDLKKKVEIEVSGASRSALEKVKKVGGTVKKAGTDTVIE